VKRGNRSQVTRCQLTQAHAIRSEIHRCGATLSKAIRARLPLESTHFRRQVAIGLRFSNRDVMLELNVVLDTIFAAIATPTPYPPHKGRGVASIRAK
jgi:very-short-patch-repair endonuclease